MEVARLQEKQGYLIHLGTVDENTGGLGHLLQVVWTRMHYSFTHPIFTQTFEHEMILEVRTVICGASIE